MAVFHDHRENIDPNNGQTPKKMISLSPKYKRKMEEICEENHVEYTVEFVNGMYIFFIDESLYPRIERYLFPFDKGKNRTVEHLSTTEFTEKKAGLMEQIGAAHRKSEGNSHVKSPAKAYKQQCESARSTVASRPNSHNGFPLNAGPHPASESPQTVPKASQSPSEKPSFTPIANVAKDLTKDVGVLTIEEQKRLDERRARSETATRPKLDRIKTGREYQVKTRLTEAEMILFRERVKVSGMKQGDFMRKCLLYENVNIRKMTDVDALVLEKIMEIASDLGRIGGLIKGTVVANKDNFAVLTPSAKTDLDRQIRVLSTLKDELQKVVQQLYGNT